jgi:hypothetical protein
MSQARKRSKSALREKAAWDAKPMIFERRASRRPSDRGQSLRVNVQACLLLQEIKEQYNPLIFPELDYLTDKAIESAPVDRHLLSNLKELFWRANSSIHFTRHQAFHEACWKPGWPVAAHHS